jgi:plasmid stabilization system protein ParE
MVFQVIWSRTALRQLREVKDYIAADNPTAADRVVHEIEERADLLQTMFRLMHRDLMKTHGTPSLVDIESSTVFCQIRNRFEF